MSGTFQHSKRYRLGGLRTSKWAQGPMSLPQGRAGGPSVPNASTVLFDFDPRKSLSIDQAGGIALTDPVGGVTRVVANGRIAAEFSGSNYLLGAASPFAALSDLVGGVSIYIISEDTGTTNTNGVVAGLYQNGAATSVNTLRIWRPQAGTGLQYFTAGAQDASNSDTDISYLQGDPNIVRQASAHITTTERGCAQGVPPFAVSGSTAIDPSSLDRVLLGAGTWAGVPNVGSFGFKGRIYRVLICEGAFDQTIADYLASLYVPRRLPPMVDPADVAFLFDPRHCMYRDTLSGINLTPASVPTRVSRAGDVATFFNGVDDYLSAAVGIGDIDSEWAIYLVAEMGATGGSYMLSMVKASTPTVEAVVTYLLDGASNGAAIIKRSTTQVTEESEENSVVGKIHLASYQVGPTSLEAWQDGVSNGATASALVPSGIDEVHLGWRPGVGHLASQHVYYALIVNTARDSTVEDWLNDQFPVGTSP